MSFEDFLGFYTDFITWVLKMGVARGKKLEKRKFFD